VHCAPRGSTSLSALDGIPFSWLKCRVFWSRLSAGTPALPLLLLQPPQTGQEGEHKGETCRAVEGPGLRQFRASRGLSVSLLSLQRPKPHAVCPGAASCRVCSGLPNAHFRTTLPGGARERRLHPVLISGRLQSRPLSLQIRNLAVPLSPSLPRQCLGGSRFMPLGHLLPGSPQVCGRAARQTPLRSAGC